MAPKSKYPTIDKEALKRTRSSHAKMLARCFDPTSPSFRSYGAKGITVCQRWRLFANFIADMGPRPYGTTLDRINNDLGYWPGNCRWATHGQQVANRSGKPTWNRQYTIEQDGQSFSIRQLAAKYGINYSTFHSRLIKHGWSIERAIATPVISRDRTSAKRRERRIESLRSRIAALQEQLNSILKESIRA